MNFTFFAQILKHLPMMKGFDFMRHIPFLMDSLVLVANIDANHDGTVDGKEKMNLAKAELVNILKSYPELNAKFNLEPAKTEAFLGKLVEAFDIVVK